MLKALEKPCFGGDVPYPIYINMCLPDLYTHLPARRGSCRPPPVPGLSSSFQPSVVLCLNTMRGLRGIRAGAYIGEDMIRTVSCIYEIFKGKSKILFKNWELVL